MRNAAGRPRLTTPLHDKLVAKGAIMGARGGWERAAYFPRNAKEAEIVSKIPLEKRMTSAEEIAAMAVFLLSDKSAHTTGQFMIPDGGYVHLDRSLT